MRRHVTLERGQAETIILGRVPIRIMHTSCRFPLDYTPPGKAHDPVLEIHLRNCKDCQAEVFVVSRTAAA